MPYFTNHFQPYRNTYNVVIAGLLVITLILNACTSLPKASPKTAEQLKTILNNEGSTSLMYGSYATRANKEGYANVSILFIALSKSHNILAKKHSALLKKLGSTMGNLATEYNMTSTQENLRKAVELEMSVVETLYPEGIQTAQNDKLTDVTHSLLGAMETRKLQIFFLKQALDLINADKEDRLSSQYAVCSGCGKTFIASNCDEKCCNCGTLKGMFLFLGEK